jgi:hypothetical protein
MLFRFIDAVADWALGPPTPRPPPPSQPRMTAADLTTPRPAEPTGPLPTGSANSTMRVGVCPFSDQAWWAAWVVDRQNRPLWYSYEYHPSEAAAQAAGERALADLRRGVRPTEP